MRLAWQCGYPHWRPMLERLGITPEEMQEIQDFAGREPLNQRRADLRAAMQTFITARAGGAKYAELDDFLPDYGAKPAIDEEQTPEEMNRQMQKVAGMFEANGK